MSEKELDRQLVEKVQQGDKRAFDLLVIKYQQRVIALVSRFVYDHAEAQDIAQEAFIKAYRALPGFRGDSAFYTWLYRIAINTAKNHLVSRARRPATVAADIEDAEQFDGAEGLRDIASPEQNALTAELEKTINRAIAELPDDLRTAITLREYDGLSYEDIADVMGCPVGTVRSRIFRARESVDEKIKPLLAS